MTADAKSTEAIEASAAKIAAALLAMAACSACLLMGWRAQRRSPHGPEPWKLPRSASRSGSDASLGATCCLSFLLDA